MSMHSVSTYTRRTMLCATTVLVMVCVLLTPRSAGAVSLAQAEPIYAVPGTLEQATGQPFLTYFVTVDGVRYAIFGATAEIDTEISRIRDLGSGIVVKVWGEFDVLVFSQCLIRSKRQKRFVFTHT